MRAVVITEQGEPDVLQVRDWPEPEAGPGVEGIEVGQRVFSGTRFGGYAERVVIPASHAVRLPDGMTFEQATAIPVNYATAWAGLIRYGGLWPGERVLIHAAAGGVGIAATHIASETGAEVWGTASPEKHEAIRAFGVEHPIDYRREGWEEGLPGFDVVLDGVGGGNFKKSYELLRPGGRLVAIGSAGVVSGDVKMPRFRVMEQMFESKSIVGVNVLRLWDNWDSREMPWVEPLSELLERGRLRPVVAAAVPFDEAPEAHRMLVERRNVGKVVLVP